MVSIYTNNEYESGDLDFISSAGTNSIAKAIGPLGFVRDGRMFSHPRTPLFVEFPAGPLAIGKQLIRPADVAEKRTAAGTLRLLTPTQCVMDRLAAYFHCNDPAVAGPGSDGGLEPRLNFSRLEEWAKREGASEKLGTFRKRLGGVRPAERCCEGA